LAVGQPVVKPKVDLLLQPGHAVAANRYRLGKGAGANVRVNGRTAFAGNSLHFLAAQQAFAGRHAVDGLEGSCGGLTHAWASRAWMRPSIQLCTSLSTNATGAFRAVLVVSLTGRGKLGSRWISR